MKRTIASLLLLAGALPAAALRPVCLPEHEDGWRQSLESSRESIVAEARRAAALRAEAEQAEGALLEDAVRRARPRLPKDQQAVVDLGLRFVISRKEPLTSTTPAWGPEDDEDYRYPDRSLYPAGTIKVNVSLMWVEALAVAKQGPDAIRAAIEDLFLAMLVHEIEHVQTYMESPIQALSMAEGAGECPGGLCDADRLRATETKVGYELRALEREYQAVRGLDPRPITAAAEQLAADPGVLTQRTGHLVMALRKLAHKIERKEPVSRNVRMFYDSQAMLPKLAREYLGLKAAGAAEGRRAEIVREFERYFELNCLAPHGILTSGTPYLVPVFDAVLGRSACPEAK